MYRLCLSHGPVASPLVNVSGELWGDITDDYVDEMSAGNSRPGGKITVVDTLTHTLLVISFQCTYDNF